jgi:hypothetical protein
VNTGEFSELATIVKQQSYEKNGPGILKSSSTTTTILKNSSFGNSPYLATAEQNSVG